MEIKQTGREGKKVYSTSFKQAYFLNPKAQNEKERTAERKVMANPPISGITG
jgi:hypothetical protein